MHPDKTYLVSMMQDDKEYAKRFFKDIVMIGELNKTKKCLNHKSKDMELIKKALDKIEKGNIESLFEEDEEDE